MSMIELWVEKEAIEVVVMAALSALENQPAIKDAVAEINRAIVDAWEDPIEGLPIEIGVQ